MFKYGLTKTNLSNYFNFRIFVNSSCVENNKFKRGQKVVFQVLKRNKMKKLFLNFNTNNSKC